MSTKRIIQIEFDGGGYTVREGDLSCPHLTWDEMLGTVAELTHPQIGSARYRMQTDEEHDAWDKKYGVQSRAVNPDAPIIDSEFAEVGEKVNRFYRTSTTPGKVSGT